jgi:hypothetical protein
MSEVTMIGIDLAKRVFQLHRTCANGTVIFRKKLTRVELLAFMSQQPACQCVAIGLILPSGSKICGFWDKWAR